MGHQLPYLAHQVGKSEKWIDFLVVLIHFLSQFKNAVFLPLRAYALTLPPIGFALKSVQTHISKQIRIEMCVCTVLKANPMGRRVRAHALKGKENFTLNSGGRCFGL